LVALPAFTAIPHPEIDSLVAGAVAGDVACFDALYRRDAERVYNLVLRSCGDTAEAEDVCQEVWSRAARSLRSLRDAGAFDTWVMRIAARACIDASRRRHVDYDETKLAALSDGHDVSEEVEEQEHRHLAWQALGALPQRQRLALYLREVDGMHYGDIAEALATTPAAVETLLFRARHALAQAYGRLADSPDERCRRARTLMAVIMDGEGDAAEQRSLKAHLGDCHACQRQMFALNRGKKTYAALPFMAAAGSFVPALLPVAGGAGLGAGGLFGVGKLMALFSQGATSLIVPAIAAATLTTASVVAAGPVQNALLRGSDMPSAVSVSFETSAGVTATQPALVSLGPVDGGSQTMTLPSLSQPVVPGAVSNLPVLPSVALPQTPTTPAEPVPPLFHSQAPQAPPAATEPVVTDPLSPAATLQQTLPVLPSIGTSLVPQTLSVPQAPQLPPVPVVPAVTSLLQSPTSVLTQLPLPQISTPAITMPSITAPPITVPVQLPPIVGLPQVAIPPVMVPSVTVPQVTVPSITQPTVQLPAAILSATQPASTLPATLPPVLPQATGVLGGLGLPLGH
jgi:RNA polymerase sigma-70 factor (ECF subfamily)